MPAAATDRPLLQAAWIAVAIGVLGDLYFFLGHLSGTIPSPLGLLWPAAAAVGLAAIIVLGCRRIAPADGRVLAIAAAALLPLAGFVAVFAALPPIARDELTHHLAIPRLYVGAGKIVEIPFADQSYYPMLLEMFYTPMLAWLPDNSPKLLHCLFGIAAAAVVALEAERRGGATRGLLAAALLLLTPVVALLLPTGYVDLGLLLYSALALTALLRWFDTEQTGWFVASALCTGFACCTKYNGLLVLVLLSIGTAFAPRRRSLPAVVGLGTAFFLLALLPLAPWLIKNAMLTGNPTYPLFHGLFGGRPLTEHPSVDIFSRRRFIHGESWLEIAAVPLRIFVSGREGSAARFDGVLNPIFLLGIAAACLGAGANRRRRLLLGFAAAYFLIAFFQTDMRVRYLLPLLPALVWLTASAVHDLGRRHSRLAGAVLAGALVFSAAHMADKWQRSDPLAYLLGNEDRETYAARFVPELPVLEYANAHLPTDARVYLAFLGTRSYYCQRPFTYETYYSGTTLRRSIEQSRSGAEILEALHADGITHMIAADRLLSRYLTHNLSDPALERWRRFATAHLRRLASHNGISLYEIG